MVREYHDNRYAANAVECRAIAEVEWWVDPGHLFRFLTKYQLNSSMKIPHAKTNNVTTATNSVRISVPDPKQRA